MRGELRKNTFRFLITHLPAPPSVGTGAGRQGFEKMIPEISGLFQKSSEDILTNLFFVIDWG
jgi:hypothetical protein